ncbi:hypothetical protein NX779_02275 [Mycoplasma cottewii]|uniref:Uncharacterized protein n=1 Tax=Mycoplasma cottewii TaxID=51364 RepID=A0ABY5TVF2_9MOLU|nr:hypothetical protein [Mycoplasma cottewii]UWD34622.1 hypothetical protein NX779_02275 [Mycoplasma cottewii]
MKKLLTFFSTLTIISTPLVSSFKPVYNIINLSSSKIENILNTLRPAELEIAKELENTYEQRAEVLKKKLELMQQELEKQKQEIQTLNNKLKEKQTELANLISGSTSTSEEQNAQTQELVKQLKDLISQQNQLNKQKEELNNQVNQLNLDNATIQHEIGKQKLKINTLRSSIHNLEKQIEDVIKTKEEKIKSLTEDLNNIKNRIEHFNNSKSQLESEIQENKIQTKNLEESTQQKEHELSQLNLTFDSNKTKLEQLQRENQQLTQQIATTGINEVIEEQETLRNAVNQLKHLKNTRKVGSLHADFKEYNHLILGGSHSRDDKAYFFNWSDSRVKPNSYIQLQSYKTTKIIKNYGNFKITDYADNWDDFVNKYKTINIKINYFHNWGWDKGYHGVDWHWEMNQSQDKVEHHWKREDWFLDYRTNFHHNLARSTKSIQKTFNLKTDTNNFWNDIYNYDIYSGYASCGIELGLVRQENILSFKVAPKVNMYVGGSYNYLFIMYIPRVEITLQADPSYITKKVDSNKNKVNAIINKYKN